MANADQSFVAIIPARGGSRGLSRKNLLPIAGKPLICHTIDAALGCAYIRGVYVSTEDAEIAGTASDAGAEVIIRPRSLASDDASSRDVVLHALDWLDAKGLRSEAFALLQPTSPCRTNTHLADCISAFLRGDYGCAISVCEAEHHPDKMLISQDGKSLVPLTIADDLDAPRQKLRKVFRQNGAIYLMGCEGFRARAQGFFLEPAFPFVMTREDSVDIDTDLDMQIARMLMESRS